MGVSRRPVELDPGSRSSGGTGTPRSRSRVASECPAGPTPCPRIQAGTTVTRRSGPSASSRQIDSNSRPWGPRRTCTSTWSAAVTWACSAARGSPPSNPSASNRAGTSAGGVGVQGARPAVVPGVERGQQVDHLGAPALADDQPVGAHPQRLPDQLAQPDPPAPSTLAVRAWRPTTCGCTGSQLGGVLDQHDPLGRRHQAEQRVEQGGLAGAGAAGDQVRQPGGDHRGEQVGRRRAARCPAGRARRG